METGIIGDCYCNFKLLEEAYNDYSGIIEEVKSALEDSVAAINYDNQ